MAEDIAPEYVVKGYALSEGIAIGRLQIVAELKPQISSEETHSIDEELFRFRQAIISSRRDLHGLQTTLFSSGSLEAVSIIDAHIKLLEDPMISQTVEHRIRETSARSERVFQELLEEYEERFQIIDDPVVYSRFIDIKDVAQRVLKHLFKGSFFQPKQGTILYTKDLGATLAAEAIEANVAGFISSSGAEMSHTALIARSQAIGYVANISEQDARCYENSVVILDGKKGVVIFNPSEQTIQAYEKEVSKASLNIESPCAHDQELITKDQVSINLFANVDDPTYIQKALCPPVEGIGLIRSEYFLLSKREEASIEKQKEWYGKFLEKVKDRYICFRVFDIGGDKKTPFFHPTEENPALGLRGIRYLLHQPTLFLDQLRALFSVAQGRNIALLLPFITDVTDVVEAKQYIYQALSELENPPLISLGAMIEVPSAVFTVDRILDHVDFISVGTNDLLQYTTAVDRGNGEILHKYGLIHPSLLYMIEHCMNVAEKRGKLASVCGEIASCAEYIPLLLGIGVRSISCNIWAIDKIIKMVQTTSITEANVLAKQAKECGSYRELRELLDKAFSDMNYSPNGSPDGRPEEESSEAFV